jgi:hypothetical protein
MYELLSHMYSCLVTELQMALQTLQRYKPPGTDQTPAEIIQAGGIYVRCEVHEPVYSLSN